MAQVIELGWGQRPATDRHLLITHVSRIRGFDFYILPGGGYMYAADRSPPELANGYASLDGALKAAQALAQKERLSKIYVERVQMAP